MFEKFEDVQNSLRKLRVVRRIPEKTKEVQERQKSKTFSRSSKGPRYFNGNPKNSKNIRGCLRTSEKI